MSANACIRMLYIKLRSIKQRIAELLHLSNTADMVQTLIILSALVTVATAVVLPAAPAYPYGYPGVAKIAAPVYPAIAKYASPVIAKVAAAPEPYDPNPQYSFSYDVHDSSTGDIKSQQESRQGDVVQGAYSLIEADGTRRIVEYTADPVQGFNAVVRREGAAVKAIAPVAKVIAAPAYAAPVYHAPAVVAKLPAYPAYAAPAVVAKAAYPAAYPGGYPGAYPGYAPATYLG